VWLGERHRQVEIRAPRIERGLEDRRVEARVDGVHDGIGSLPARELGDRGRIRGIQLDPRKATVAATLDRVARAGFVEVGEDHALEEVAAARNRAHRGADAACPDNKNAHREKPTAARAMLCG
jgi:hypothetical protein